MITKVSYLQGRIEVNEEEPTTLEEILPQLGELELVRQAINHYRYHYKYPRVYAEVSRRIEKEYIKETNEKPIAHILRYYKSFKEGDPGLAKLHYLFQEVATSQSLIPSTERGASGPIAQHAIDAAAQFLAEGRAKTVAKTIEDLIAGYKIEVDSDGTPTLEGLARGIQRAKKEASRAVATKIQAS